MEVDFDWIRSEFRRSLCALGADGARALAQYPDGCAKADELAEDYSTWLVAYLQHFPDEFDREQRRVLSNVDRLLDGMSGSHNRELWTEEAVANHPRWEEVRSAAASAIDAIALDCSANPRLQADAAQPRQEAAGTVEGDSYNGTMAETLRQRRLALIGGAAAVFMVTLASVIGGYPSHFSSFALVPLILRLVLGLVGAGSVLAVAYLALSWRCVSGSGKVPTVSALLGLAIAIGSFLWFRSGWEYGEEYQGQSVVWTWAVLNALNVAVLLAVYLSARKSASWARAAFFHWHLFVWATCWAFPYLGETP